MLDLQLTLSPQPLDYDIQRHLLESMNGELAFEIKKKTNPFTDFDLWLSWVEQTEQALEKAYRRKK